MIFGSSSGLRRPSKLPRSGCRPVSVTIMYAAPAIGKIPMTSNISRAVSGGHNLEHRQFHISLLDQSRQ